MKRCLHFIQKGFISRGIKLLENNGTLPISGDIIDQLKSKHPQRDFSWATPPRRADGEDEVKLGASLTKVVHKLDPTAGVGPRGMRTAYTKALLEGRFTDDRAKNAFESFEHLGTLYLQGDMPPWLARTLGGGLLTAAAKEDPNEVRDPTKTDVRPVKAEDADTGPWCKALQAQCASAIREQVKPHQVGVGVPGGCEILVLGTRAKVDEAKRHNHSRVLVLLDIRNAHNAYCREAAQKAIEDAASKDSTLSPLVHAHTAISRVYSDVFIRDPTFNKLSHFTQSRSGGGQGNPLTNIIFPLTINTAIKNTVAAYPDVEIHAQQDDMSIFGDPTDIFGPSGDDGALAFLENQLDQLKLEPNRKKYKALTIGTDLDATSLPPWLDCPFEITDPTLATHVESLEEVADQAEKAAKHNDDQHLQEEASRARQCAKQAKSDVPEEHRSYGVWLCGSAIGDDDYVRLRLKKKTTELWGDQAKTDPRGKIEKTAQNLMAESAHVAHSVIYYSLQCRIDWLLATHLPSQTKDLAHAADSVLRRIYKQCYGCDLLDTEGSNLLVGQRDPEFTSTLFGLKARQGGGGARSHNDRAPFLNAMNTAAHWMVAEKIWPSMSTILGDTWLNDDQTEINWDDFHTSGSSLAVEHRAEIERLKSLWETSKSSLTHQQLEKVDSSIIDAPTNRLGIGKTKIQRQIFDLIKTARHKDLENRARNMAAGDERRLAFTQSRRCKCANQILVLIPTKTATYTNTVWRSTVQNKFGVPQQMCLPHLGKKIRHNRANQDHIVVDRYGHNVKNAVNLPGNANRTRLHDTVCNTVSDLLNEANITHTSTKTSKHRNKEYFSRQVNVPQNDKEAEKWLSGIIPDIVIDGTNLPPIPSKDSSGLEFSSHQTLCDVKTFAINRNTLRWMRHDEPSPAVQTRQNKIAGEYRSHSKKLDERLHGTQPSQTGPIESRLNEFNSGHVAGLVVGPFAEISTHLDILLEHIAEAKADQLCQFYDLPPHEAKAYELNQIRRKLCFTCHQAIARQLEAGLQLDDSLDDPSHRRHQNADDLTSDCDRFVFFNGVRNR